MHNPCALSLTTASICETASQFIQDKLTLLTHSLSHSVDRLTSDGSLRHPDLTITGHVPSDIRGEVDINLLQLADPGLSRTASWSLPFRPVIRSVTRSGVDDQTQCFVCRCSFSQMTYMSSVVTVIETGTEIAVFSSKPNRNRPTLASMKP